MRFTAGCLLVVLLAVTADAAVLVRFINTVPQRFDNAPWVGGDRAVLNEALPGAATRFNEQVDRVGLQYFPTSSSRTLVWTSIPATTETAATNAVAPFAYSFAMPPLRSAHRNLKLSEFRTFDTDTVATSSKTAHTANSDTTTDPSTASTYEQSTLRADGVCGYMSFAAGTYRMSAYGVLGVITGVNDVNSQSRFDFADSTFTFEDNKVYTLVAYGNGAFTATPAGTANTVQLTMITESVLPTDFAMASIRFFHGIERASAVSISVSSGSNTVASGVGFGSVSNYMSFKAAKGVHFTVSRSDSTTKDETDLTQTHDIRAGLRATLFCAVNNLATPAVFCRMIPSRVVAYVRLVHDAASQTRLIQGRFGPQMLSETKLSLWASFEYPRPEDPQAWTQEIGDVVTTGNPLTTRGLYPVVTNVAANQVSGYGEVHVPVFIMDFAVRNVIGYTTQSLLTGAAKPAASMNINANRNSPNWWFYAPMFKRVSVIVKTDGYATVAGQKGTTMPLTALDLSGAGGAHVGYFDAATGADTLASSLMTDLYMEPGQFYSVFASTNTRTTTVTRIQSDGLVRFGLRLDMSVDDVHNDLLSTTGSVIFVPFARNVGSDPTVANIQDFVAGGNKIVINGPGSSGVSTERTWGNSAVAVRVPTIGDILTVADTGYPAQEKAVQMTPGTYTYSQKTAGATCFANLPSGSFTITAGVRTEIFVLNTEGCFPTTSLSSLVTVVTQMQSATVSGHAPTVATVATREVREVPFYSAASSVQMSLSVLFAAIMAAVALIAW